MIRFLAVALAWMCGSIAFIAAQGEPADSNFRVFLTDGRALASYGEPAWVGDRVVFTMLIGERDAASRQQTLVDLPIASIDRERTLAYADSLRAAYYARTRAEADFAVMTEEVSRAVDRLTSIADPGERLAAAEQARERLLEFSRRSRGYRAADVGILLVRFDQVLADLRAAAGDASLSFELSSGPTAPLEPLLRPVGLQDSIALALAAVNAADTGEVRLSILRAAAAAIPADPAFDDARSAVETRIDMERTLEREYAGLDRGLRSRATAARDRGDPGAVARAIGQLDRRDEELGGHRPQLVARLRGDMETWHASARAFRTALDHYAAVRADLLAYERRVRPAYVAFDGLRPVFEALRDLQFTSYDSLLRAEERLGRAIGTLAAAAPPPDLAAVHATFASALHLAREAIERRKQAAATALASTNQDAASAAAGALMLAAQAHQDLVIGLFPPKPR